MSHNFEPTQAEKDLMSMMQSSPAVHTNYERITENKEIGRAHV
jgi:hypothetical protein